MADVTLKPCPFCGSPGELEHGNDHHGNWFNLGCSDHWGKRTDGLGCKAGRLWYTETDTPEADAIAAWNTRPGARGDEMTECNSKCTDCGRFMRDGTWAAIFDLVAMELSHEHWRCTRCTGKLGPAQSNARPHNGDMTPYEGRLGRGEVA